MTPIERSARALYRSAPHDFDPNQMGEDATWPDLVGQVRAVIEAVRDSLDESGLVEAARQSAEIDGSTAATWASMTYDDVIEWFDTAINAKSADQ